MAAGQVPFATSLALNRTAELARNVLQVEMHRVFDRPKPFTLKSIFIRRATKRDLTARIFHSDKVSPYLQAEIEGGKRDEKRSEIKLGEGVLVPTRNVRLDSYGGVSRAYLARVLSGAQEGRGGYVLIRPGQASRLAPGVYQRVDGTIRALFLFKTSASYQPRYDMEGVVQRVVDAEFGRQFAAAMDFALATARVQI